MDTHKIEIPVELRHRDLFLFIQLNKKKDQIQKLLLSKEQWICEDGLPYINQLH